MKLYYYSLKRKEFSPLFPSTVTEAELNEINRFKTTSKGILPLVAWALWAGAGYVGTKLFGDFALDTAGNMALTLLEMLAKGIFWVAGQFMTGMAYILDNAILYTISSDLYANLEVIDVGWTTVRDFSNMFFIFALLYIAIKTILGMGGGSTKKWVANLIIAALLINFSLFFTKVVIDSGNVLAMGFWEKMEMHPGQNDPSVSQHLIHGLKLQSTLDTSLKNDGKIAETEPLKRVIIYLGGAIVLFVAGYVFLAGAIMMIVRTVSLIFLMIVSPFAFLGFALPTSGGWSNTWLNKLISSTFVAPAFLAMLYLVVTIINGLDLEKMAGASGTKFGAMFAGDKASFLIIYNYLLVIILMLTSLTVANSVSAGAGTSAGNWAKKGLGRGAALGFVAGGAVGRQSLGRIGKATAENKKLNEMAKSSNRFVRLAGNAGLASAEKLKKGTFDARNAGANKVLGLGGINAGVGSNKSYDTHGGRLVGTVLAASTAAVKGSVPDSVGKYIPQAEVYRGTTNEKEIIAQGLSRFPNDPVARKKFYEDKGVQLDEKRNKALKSELARGEVFEEHKEKLKQNTKDYASLQQRLKNEEITAEQFKTEGDKIAEAVKNSLARLSGKESADVLNQDMLKMAPVIAALQSKDLSALNTKADELEPETIKAINEGVVQGGTESARNYMKNQAAMGGQFAYNAEENLKSLTSDYDKQTNGINGALKDKPAELEEYKKKQTEAIGKALGMAGNAESIKSMSDTIITHEAVVGSMNKKVANELRKKLKDTDEKLAKEFDEKLALHNKHFVPDETISPKDAAAERSAPKATVIKPSTNGPDKPLDFA